MGQLEACHEACPHNLRNGIGTQVLSDVASSADNTAKSIWKSPYLLFTHVRKSTVLE